MFSQKPKYAASGQLGHLLAQHVETVWAAIPDLTETDTAPVAQGMLNLMALSLAKEAQETDSPRGGVTAPLKQAILVYLEDHLLRQVSIAELVQRFNVSRSVLYRMFEPEGGLQSHMRARRLALAFRTLSDPQNAHMGIGEIAFACGFQSNAHFTRLFRQRFSMRPSDVRNAREMLAPSEVHAMRPSDPHARTSIERRRLQQWLSALPGQVSGAAVDKI